MNRPRTLRELRRFVLVAGIGALLAFTAAHAAAQDDPKPALATKDTSQQPTATAIAAPAKVEAWRESIALVKGERGGHGSAFVVRPGVVVTNSHVIRSEFLADVRVRFISPSDPNPKPLKVELLYENSRRDLALLKVIAEQPALKLAHNHVFAEGREVLVLGNPGQGDAREWARINKVVEGATVGIARAFDEPFYELKVPDTTPGGFSGGPVVDRVSGEVIGILTAGIFELEVAGNRKRQKATPTSFCIPVQALHAALYKLDAPDAAKTAVLSEKNHHQALMVEEIHRAHKRCIQNLQARIDLAGKNSNPYAAPSIAIKDRAILAREQNAHKASMARINVATQKTNNQLKNSVNDLVKNYQATHNLHTGRFQLPVVDRIHGLKEKHDQLMRKIVRDLELFESFLEGISPD